MVRELAAKCGINCGECSYKEKFNCLVSYIANQITFDEGILDAQMPPNSKDDAGHRRCILWWLGAGRPSPCRLVSFGT